MAPHDPRASDDRFTFPAEAIAPERFDRAAHDPAYPPALDHAPPAPPDNGDALGWIAVLFGVFLLSVPLIDADNRAGLLFHVAMVGFGLIVVALGVLSLRSAKEFRLAPIERQVVVMLKHYVYQHRGAKGSVSSHQRMLLALRTREILDVSCSEELVRRIRPGDLGMAFLKLAVLVDFIPLRDDCEARARAAPSSGA